MHGVAVGYMSLLQVFVGFFVFFFFNDTATTEIYTLSLHDALPISAAPSRPSPPSSNWINPTPTSCPISPLPSSSKPPPRRPPSYERCRRPPARYPQPRLPNRSGCRS